MGDDVLLWWFHGDAWEKLEKPGGWRRMEGESEKHKFPPTLLNFIANSLGIGDFELYRLAAWMHRCSWSKESPELSG